MAWTEADFADALKVLNDKSIPDDDEDKVALATEFEAELNAREGNLGPPIGDHTAGVPRAEVGPPSGQGWDGSKYTGTTENPGMRTLDSEIAPITQPIADVATGAVNAIPGVAALGSAVNDATGANVMVDDASVAQAHQRSPWLTAAGQAAPQAAATLLTGGAGMIPALAQRAGLQATAAAPVATTMVGRIAGNAALGAAAEGGDTALRSGLDATPGQLGRGMVQGAALNTALGTVPGEIARVRAEKATAALPDQEGLDLASAQEAVLTTGASPAQVNKAVGNELTIDRVVERPQSHPLGQGRGEELLDPRQALGEGINRLGVGTGSITTGGGSIVQVKSDGAPGTPQRYLDDARALRKAVDAEQNEIVDSVRANIDTAVVADRLRERMTAMNENPAMPQGPIQALERLIERFDAKPQGALPRERWGERGKEMSVRELWDIRNEVLANYSKKGYMADVRKALDESISDAVSEQVKLSRVVLGNTPSGYGRVERWKQSLRDGDVADQVEQLAEAGLNSQRQVEQWQTQTVGRAVQTKAMDMAKKLAESVGVRTTRPARDRAMEATSLRAQEARGGRPTGSALSMVVRNFGAVPGEPGIVESERAKGQNAILSSPRAMDEMMKKARSR